MIKYSNILNLISFCVGGRIDHAHHDNIAYRALDETLMFAEAVTKAVELTDINDTLIVVTGDHSHSFAFSGYPEMDSDILGEVLFLLLMLDVSTVSICRDFS